MSDALVSLRADGVGLLLDVSGPLLPRVLHWGRDLGEVGPAAADDVRRALTPPVPHSALDEPWPLTLLPAEVEGWSGAPGLSGHRAGAAAYPRLRLAEPVSVEHGADGGGRLVARAADEVCGVAVEVVLELSVQGVLSTSTTVTNTGSGTYDVGAVRALLPLPPQATEVMDLTGRWCRERSPQRRPLHQGTTWRPSRRGRTGHDATLLMAAGTAGFGFGHGEVWAAHVAWSGDHEHLVERLPEGAGGHAAVLGGGELLRPGEVRLEEGASYSAPAVVAVWSGDGLDGVSDRLHRWQRARAGHPSSPRPVVLNTWEAVYFDHDLDRLRRLADVAARVGVERFVLDDGWFRGRRHDRAGLGDWWVDEDVWPAGLRPLVDHVRGLGMQVGLWVEPEMANPDSDLVREHPEWLLQPGDGELPPAWRHQQVVDLTHRPAWEYLLERLDAVVAEHGIDFLKWDHNRDLHAAGAAPSGGAGGAGAARGAGVHGQTLALYALLDALRARHPGLEIESCSSGGARVDLGVLARTDRVWASDCNDALERQPLQLWTSLLLPPELVGAHVGPPRAHTTGRVHDLSFRCATALFGHAGIEWDLTSCTPEELEQVAAWTALHRELRPLLHTGRVVRGDLPDTALLHGVVAHDRSEAVYSYARLTTGPDAGPGRVRLPGLDADLTYRVRVRDELGLARTVQTAPPGWTADGVVLSGALLGGVGLALPLLVPAAATVLHVTAAP